ncbi:MAG: hypothetical protein IJX63_12405 [Lachnospiraceae bacterium]|nr:hypothetical protein [Lachnospiraceae bacterium]
MDLYGERKNAWKTVVFLCLIMLVFLIGDLVQKDVFFSESENRILASKPKLSKESVTSGKYMEQYEEYVNDQFVSRNNWIAMKTHMDIWMQKKVINGVYLAEDDYLIEQHLAEDFPQETIEKRLTLLKQLVQDYPQTKVMLVPTADNILTDKLPAFAPYYDQRDLLEQVKESVGEAHVIDMFPVLEAHTEEEIYYRTDHHWTTLGAYYGYEAFTKAYGLPTRWYLKGEMETVTDSFLGSLHSKLNLPTEAEEIKIFPRTLETKIQITYDFTKKTNSFYSDSYLQGKNKYGYFLDDNHAVIEMEREAFSERVLFVIKDSYANSMLPMLAHHYRKIYVLDLRYFSGNLADFMQSCDEYGNMDVLVLYNCVHFVNDFATIQSYEDM